MKDQGRTLLQKDGTKTVLASLLSIVIGLAVGSILVLVVGLFSDNLGMASAWEGIAQETDTSFRDAPWIL